MKRKLLAIAVAVVGLCAVSVAQGAHFYTTLVSGNPSRPVPNVSVRVCTEPATGTTCTPLATLYSDIGLSTPLSNPFTGDASGNVSFYAAPGFYHIQYTSPALPNQIDVPYVQLPGNSTLGLQIVSFSATPTFNAGLYNSFEMTLTGNVTSSTVTGAVVGQQLNFIIQQDGTGGRTFAWPANFVNAPAVGALASASTSASFVYDGTNWQAQANATNITAKGINAQVIEQVRFSDQFPGSDICAQANAAASALVAAVGGGLVVIPTGAYTAATQCTPPSHVTYVGQGMNATVITFTGSGDEFYLNQTEKAGIANLSIVLPASTASVGIHMTASSAQTCVYNNIEDVDISAPTLFSGQYGVKLDGNSCVFNWFRRLLLRNLDQPIVSTGSSERNHFDDIQINSFAASNSGAAIYANGNDDQYNLISCGLGGSTANPIYCMNINAADVQAVNIFGDLGSHGSTITGSGNAPQFWSGAIGSTLFGTVTGGYLNSLGRNRDASAYEVNAMCISSQDCSAFQIGVAGYSNGLTIDYQHTGPQSMRYAFLNGPVGIGNQPPFSNPVGLYLGGTPSTSGILNFSAGQSLYARNSGNSADIGLIGEVNDALLGDVALVAPTSAALFDGSAYLKNAHSLFSKNAAGNATIALIEDDGTDTVQVGGGNNVHVGALLNATTLEQNSIAVVKATDCGTDATCASPVVKAGLQVTLHPSFSASTTLSLSGLPFNSATSFVCSVSDGAHPAYTFGSNNASGTATTITASTSNSDPVVIRCNGW